MTLGCPVGHPSGPGQHCPLCGRAYVDLDAVPRASSAVPRAAVPVPQPRAAVPDPPAQDPATAEALALLSSLASEL